MKYKINKRQVKLKQNDTTCPLHVMKFELTQNKKNKIRLWVAQQGNPLFRLWWDTEKYNFVMLTYKIHKIY